MAYIHKATVYFIDPNEKFETVKDIAEEMRNYDHLPYMKVGKPETKDFDWDDDIIVNKMDCTWEQAEEFFQNVKPKKIIPTFWYRVIVSDKGVENVNFLNSSKCTSYQEVFEAKNISLADGHTYFYYYIDVEAEGPKEAEEIAKTKVLDYIHSKQEKELNKLRGVFFK